MNVVTDWSNYPNFTREEMACKHTRRCEMKVEFMDRLQALRTAFKKPLIVTSGYRDPTHPVERAKQGPGVHTLGRAVDISIRGEEALDLICLARQLGFTGFGVYQNGPVRYLHLDDLGPKSGFHRPTIWSK